MCESTRNVSLTYTELVMLARGLKDIHHNLLMSQEEVWDCIDKLESAIDSIIKERAN